MATEPREQFKNRRSRVEREPVEGYEASEWVLFVSLALIVLALAGFIVIFAWRAIEAVS